MSDRPSVIVGFQLFGAESWFEPQVQRLRADGRLQLQLSQPRPRMEIWGLEVPVDWTDPRGGRLDAGAVSGAFATAQGVLDSLKLGMVARAHLVTHDEQGATMLWGLPWQGLPCRDGTLLEARLPADQRTYAREIQRGLDRLVQPPWRALGRLGTNRWSLMVAEAVTARGEVPFVGIEVASAAHHPGQASPRPFEQEELEARRRSTVEHLSALEVTATPDLWLLAFDAS